MRGEISLGTIRFRVAVAVARSAVPLTQRDIRRDIPDLTKRQLDDAIRGLIRRGHVRVVSRGYYGRRH